MKELIEYIQTVAFYLVATLIYAAAVAVGMVGIMWMFKGAMYVAP